MNVNEIRMPTPTATAALTMRFRSSSRCSRNDIFVPGGRVFLFLDADFFLERIPELVRGFLELGEAFSQRTAQFGQLARAKDDQSDHKNDDQLGHSDGTKHDVLLSRCRNRCGTGYVIIETGRRKGQGIPPGGCPE